MAPAVMIAAAVGVLLTVADLVLWRRTQPDMGPPLGAGSSLWFFSATLLVPLTGALFTFLPLVLLAIAQQDRVIDRDAMTTWLSAGLFVVSFSATIRLSSVIRAWRHGTRPAIEFARLNLAYFSGWALLVAVLWIGSDTQGIIALIEHIFIGAIIFILIAAWVAQRRALENT